MRHDDFADMVNALMDDDSDKGEATRARFMTGCNADDTTDSRGEELRPLVNDAGEPWWM